MTAEQRLTQQIQRALERDGIEAIVTVENGTVRLEGMIGSAELRDAASQVAQQIAPDATIDNQLEVIPILPLPELPEDEPEQDQLVAALHTLGEEAQQQVQEKQHRASRDLDDWARDPGSAEPVFAPTDPVVRMGRRGLEILGGFAETSEDETALEPPDVGQRRPRVRGDAEIADDVIRELADDAATADLVVHVNVRSGVVRLTGVVPTLADADAAEEIAARVPGVVEIDERLQVAANP